MGGLCVVEPVDHGDAVAISWRPIMKKAGVDIYFVQDNQSMSTEGAAHCFLVLSDEAEFCYKVNNFLHPMMRVAWLGIIRKSTLNGRNWRKNTKAMLMQKAIH